MTPEKISPRSTNFKKLDYYDSFGRTVTTASESSVSLSSGCISPDYSITRRKKKRWYSAYNNGSGSVYWEEQSDRTIRNIFFLFSALVVLFLMQVWGLRMIAKLQQHFIPLSQFNTINPNIDWCPQAACHNSPVCYPCDRKFLIVIATGRSGSTTLTDMLDLLPGVRMAGENNGHLTYGFHAMNNLEETEAFHLDSRKKIEGAWRHYPIPEQSTACPIQKMFESLNPPSEQAMRRFHARFDDSDDIIGFKTVRFHSEEFGRSHEKSVDFLMKTFPCARFIINIRGDVKAQVSSWSKAFGVGMDGDSIRGYNLRLEKVAAQLGKDRARLIDMSEWSQKDGSGLRVLNEMVEWLGFKDCQFSSLIHSNKDGYGHDTQKYSVGDYCRRIGQ